MSQDSFTARARALEDAFLAKVDAQLLANLRSSMDRDKDIQELAAYTGITDTAVVQALVDSGVNLETATALRIFPLVAVAWADNVVQHEEREIVLEAAHKHGIKRDRPCGKLLEAWLTKKPKDDIFDAWEAYIKSLLTIIPAADVDRLRTNIEKDIKHVAQSTGGILGWAAVSAGESEVMKRIMAALK